MQYFANINPSKGTLDMKERTYYIREFFGRDEIEVTYEGNEDFEWSSERGLYLFSCLVGEVSGDSLGKCYGEVSERAYEANVDIDNILSNPREYNLCVEF